MAQVTIPKSFFVKERNHLYSDWKTAFFRELFQNSGDAGCGLVNVNIYTEDDDTIVEFIDNGTGMSASTIEEVFFALGETTKAEDGGIGGFGRARILTCFATRSYEFWTNNHYCHGDGSEYFIEDSDEFVHGCKFIINLGKEDFWSIRNALKTVLEYSQLPYDVFIDGEKFTDWMYKRRMVKTASFGNIHVNKSGYSDGYIYIRVNGLWTFSLYTSAKPQIVVEVDPQKCREILTVNRDSMHYAYQNDLGAFVEELAVDKRSALRENRRKTRLIEGTGVHVSHHDVPEEVSVKPYWNTPETAMTAAIGGGVAAAVAARPVGDVEREYVTGDMIQTNLPTIYLNDGTSEHSEGDRRIRKIIDQYDPTNWTFFRKKKTANNEGTEVFRKGGTKLKLLIVWETCCREAVRAYLEATNLPKANWLVGWTFDRELRACHENLFEGDALCLNPVKDDGTMRYKIRSRADQKALMALAKHEVTHMVHKYHDEDFSTLHTEIDALFNEVVCARMIKEALKAA